MEKDKSYKAPDTTAFKNIRPDDLPKSTYTYKGDNVGNSGNMPKDSYSYKGDNVGKGGALPKSSYNYKGDKSAGKASK